MDAMVILYKFQMECFEVFKAQDPDTGDFDVVFEIDEKKLYAHRHRLNAISPTFKSMLSDRWNSNKEEPLQIKDYKFEDFKEFLTFIYSGECNLNDENVYNLLDMAEFYGVKLFKNSCAQYLSNMDIDFQNIFHIIKIAKKYSLTYLKYNAELYLKNNFASFITSQEFDSLQRSDMKNVVEENQCAVKIEELFIAVFKWAEKEAIKKQKIDRSVLLNDAIKEELADILPLLNFKNMDTEFFNKFVATKTYLFSANELHDIQEHFRRKVYVKITDTNGKTANGILICPDMDKIVEVIHSLKNVSSRYYYWTTSQCEPSQPSKLSKNDEVEWYLVYDCDGDLAFRKRLHLIDTDYLLAEMFADEDFESLGTHKIETYSLT